MPQYNTFKQRIYLYRKTFMNWKIERRLSTLEQMAIESSLAVHKFGNNASEVNFKKLAESLSDIETMIEVATLSFPDLRNQMDDIRKEKLNNLYNSNKEKEKLENTKKAEIKVVKKEDNVEINAEEVPEKDIKIKKTVKKERNVFDLIKFKKKK